PANSLSEILQPPAEPLQACCRDNRSARQRVEISPGNSAENNARNPAALAQCGVLHCTRESTATNSGYSRGMINRFNIKTPRRKAALLQTELPLDAEFLDTLA